MNPIDYSVWIVGLALDIAALVMLRQRTLRLVSLYGYLCFAITRTISLAAIYLYAPHLYSSAYWALRPCGFLVDIALATEICWRVSSGRRYRLVAGCGILALLLYLLAWLGFEWHSYRAAVFALSRTSAALRLAIFFLSVVIAKRWPWPLQGVAAGFGLMTATGLAVSAIAVFSGPHSWEVIRRLLPLCEISGLAAWVYSLSFHPQFIQPKAHTLQDIKAAIQLHTFALRESPIE